MGTFMAQTERRLAETEALIARLDESLLEHPDDRATEINLWSLRKLKSQLEIDLQDFLSPSSPAPRTKRTRQSSQSI